MLDNARPTQYLSDTPEYRVWAGIKTRCYNKNANSYDDYGGRGIQMCDEWLTSFEQFATDMGERPTKHHQIERIDNNANYCKDNCRWATKREQANNRRTNRIITHRGESQTVAEWSRITGIAEATIRRRIDRGWSIRQALELPIGSFVFK
ncbi:hypothetical protein [Symmachiella dynata]|uniref:hypothetical protein n=1 Tax=Symmachiella dynata TaxID=2527995 RepID=UPI0011A1C0C9|nr:hypothetical protein [Symmachiella dynata]